MNEVELLTALQKAMQAPAGDEGATLGELTESLRIGAERMRRAMKALIQAGRAECRKGRRPSMDGRMQVVPVYRLMGKGKRRAA